MSGNPKTEPEQDQSGQSQSVNDRNLRPTLFAAGCLVLLCMVVFGRVLSFGFTNWDDRHYIERNPLLTKPTAASLKRIFTPRGVAREQLYIPLTYTSYWIESRTRGLWPKVVHSTNLMLHIANVLLVFLLLTTVGCPRLASLVGGAVFAVHPLQVEGVAWCMGRKDLLAAFFALGAIYCYLKQLRSGKRQWLIACAVFTPAAMLAKPSVILLPGILVLLHLVSLVRMGRVHWGFIAACAGFSGLVYHVNTYTSVPAAASDMPGIGTRLAAVPALMIDTAVRFVGMYGLSPIYPWPTSTGILAIKCFAAIAVGVGIVWVLRKQVVFIPVVLIVGLAFLPAVSLVVQYREFFTADRYCYFPMIGIAWIVAMIFSRLVINGHMVGTGAITAWVAYAAVVASFQVNHWESSLAIWQRASRFAPTNSLVFNNLGSALVEAGNLDKAVDAYERSLLLNPKNFRAWNNLAEVSLRQQRYEEAIAASEKAVKLNANYPQAHHNWGMALLALGRCAESIDHFRLGAKHGYPASIRAMGLAFEREKQPAKAEICYRQLIKIQPSSDAHFLMGKLLAAQGKTAAAIVELDKALSLGGHAEAAGLRSKLKGQ